MWWCWKRTNVFTCELSLCAYAHTCILHMQTWVSMFYAHCVYLHLGNQTCYTYALYAPTRRATFACMLFSGNQHQPICVDGLMQRVSLSGGPHSGHLPWRWAISGKGVEWKRKAGRSPKSKQTKLWGTSAPRTRATPKAFWKELQAEIASPHRFPALSAQCVTMSGLSTIPPTQAFLSSSSSSSAKTWRRYRSGQWPPCRNKSLLPAGSRDPPSILLKTGQTGARGVEILQRPEAGQGGLVFSPLGWGGWVDLPLRR